MVQSLNTLTIAILALSWSLERPGRFMVWFLRILAAVCIISVIEDAIIALPGLIAEHWHGR